MDRKREGFFLAFSFQSYSVLIVILILILVPVLIPVLIPILIPLLLF